MGGVGYLPASGTFASLLTCVLLSPAIAFASPVLRTSVEVLGIFLFGSLNVWLGPWAIATFGDKDPGQCVLDEGAGICLTMLLLPTGHGAAVWIALAAAFVAFRIFDITKPPPARQLEHLPAGWGILMDDLMAAIYANLVCQLFLRWALHWR